ncbi:response regulator [Marinobacterium jannaschii]|uniref:response regulator n=1 Tax=Marinobacterium jannaschii TaxID=64970 RepID=UPI0004837846|nr:response regulator [Marinobacterium jannaschii]
MAMAVTVCDDSMMSRKSVIRALPDDWDVELTQACNGREAIEACHAGKAEVLFLDLTMPVMDGLEVLQQLKQEDANTVTIVISADFQAEVSQRVIELGALSFITKPVTKERLADVLRQVGLI